MSHWQACKREARVGPMAPTTSSMCAQRPMRNPIAVMSLAPRARPCTRVAEQPIMVLADQRACSSPDRPRSGVRGSPPPMHMSEPRPSPSEHSSPSSSP
eukprot:6188434-Pleurochrysis_carterae.AAC.2